VEVTIAHTGALQGAVKRHIGEPEAASRVSRKALLSLFVDVVGKSLRIVGAGGGVMEGVEKEKVLKGELGRLLDLLREIDSKAVTSKNQLSLPSTSESDESTTVADSGTSNTAGEGRGSGTAIDEDEWWVSALHSRPYYWWKQNCSVQYLNRRRIFLTCLPFNNWLCDDPESGSGLTSCLQNDPHQS
jgi:hypothetical protein